jgi:hypothetical protein
LAAINEAASGLKKPSNMQQHSDLISEAKVSHRMERDLVSHASRAADMSDFHDKE